MLLVLLLSLVLLQGEALAAGEWLTTEGGCKVWNPTPVLNETAVWVGAVDAEGYASGKGIYIWDNDERYEGDFAAGERTGYGVFIKRNSERYEGKFVDGKPVKQ